MKAKTFLILAVVVCALSLAAYTLILKQERGGPKARLGEKLYTNLPVNDVAQIRITTPKGSVTLNRGASVWEVKERWGFPADFLEISNLVKKVAALKIGRSFKADPESVARLSLGPMDASADAKEANQEESGFHLVLASEKGDVLADLLVGKARATDSGSGGQYVKAAGSDEIVLVDKDFKYTSKTAEDWINKDLFKIEPEDIRSVTCLDPDKNPVYRLERPEKSKDPQLEGADPDREIDDAKISQAFDTLSNFMVEDVAAPDTQVEAAAHVFEYRLFNGACYTLYPSKSGDGDDAVHYLKAGVEFHPEDIHPSRLKKRRRQMQTSRPGTKRKRPPPQKPTRKKSKRKTTGSARGPM